MAKRTVLDMTQSILSEMDSDNVNSIDDTEESLQVANIIKDTFFEILTDGDWPHLNTLFALSASGTSVRPTHMTLPENVQEVKSVKYNVKTSATAKDVYMDITYLYPDEFLAMLSQRTSTASNVDAITDPGGVPLLIVNDSAPTYYTSFDNDILVFDAYDSDLENTLQGSKTQCWGPREPTFSLTDNHIPDLPSKGFPFLLSESKSKCFNTLKQSANPKEEAIAGRQRRRMSQSRYRLAGGIRYPNYGRRGKK